MIRKNLALLIRDGIVKEADGRYAQAGRPRRGIT
jgi:hypothetical protein